MDDETSISILFFDRGFGRGCVCTQHIYDNLAGENIFFELNMRETSAFVEIVSKPARVFIDTYQPIHDGNGKTNLKGRTYTYQSTLDKGTTS